MKLIKFFLFQLYCIIFLFSLSIGNAEVLYHYEGVNALPLLESISVSELNDEVEVIFDIFGTPHIYSKNRYDAFLVQGYVTARDRFFEMDIARSYAEGRLAEILGNISVNGTLLGLSIINNIDLQTRAIMTSPNGTDLIAENLNMLNNDVLNILEAYSKGVNLFLEDAINKRNSASLSSQYLQGFLGFPPEAIPKWKPYDTVAIGLLQAWLGYTTGEDIDFTKIYTHLSPSIIHDIIRSAPSEPNIVIPDYFNKFFSISGTYSFTPFIEDRLIDKWSDILKKSPILYHKSNHSNNWAISGSLTYNGFPLVANDPHLTPTNPTFFYHIHIEVSESNNGFNIVGLSMPGTPGIVIGHNNYIAWGQTSIGYDLTDIYKETINPIKNTVLFKGKQVPLKRIYQTFYIGRGKNRKSVTLPIDIVPHHGPIIPNTKIDNYALSLRWTGQEPSTMINSYMNLISVKNVYEMIENLKSLQVGPYNWVFADIEGNIGYSGDAKIPIRENMTKYPPYMLLPGEGGAEWVGFLPDEKIPRDINPKRGYITSSNNDVIGTTLDNDPLNEGIYLYHSRKLGFRGKRIIDKIEEKRGYLTFEDMKDLQKDNFSLCGKRFLPFILKASQNLPNKVTSKMKEALSFLKAWDFSTPTGVKSYYRMDEPTEYEITQSVATSIFHAWLNDFIVSTLRDDFLKAKIDLPGNIGEDGPQFEVKGLLFILEHPEESLTKEKLFDDVNTLNVETRDEIILKSLQNSLITLTNLFKTPNMKEWRWGKIHQIKFGLGAYGITLPENLSPVIGPYPNDGANFTVDVGNTKGLYNSFEQVHAPIARIIMEVERKEFRTESILSTGQSERSNDPHNNDQAYYWFRNEYIPLYSTKNKVLEVAHYSYKFIRGINE